MCSSFALRCPTAKRSQASECLNSASASEPRVFSASLINFGIENRRRGVGRVHHEEDEICFYFFSGAEKANGSS